MIRSIRPFLLLLLMGTAPALRAQIELFPYLGYALNGEARVQQLPGLDLVSTQGAWVLGTEALIGRRRLAPLAGLALEITQEAQVDNRGTLGSTVDPAVVRVARSNRLLPTLGLAYRLQPATYSFNALLTAAVTLDVPLGSDEAPFAAAPTTVVPRVGGRLTFDFVVVGLDYYHQLRAETYENQFPSRLVVTLGGRF